MRQPWIAAFLLCLLAACSGQEPAESAESPEAAEPAADSGSEEPALDSPEARLSYSIGLDVGKNLRGQVEDVDFQLLLRGIEDAYREREPLLSQDEVRESMVAFQRERAQKQQEERRAAAEENREKGEAFLEENRKREGVVTLESGLQYEVLQEGKGESPGPDDRVSVHYRGTLLDGTEFDSSYRRGRAASFPVGGVIAGWTEALQLMKEGAKWKLYIPSELAYGERGAGAKIGPNAVLVFEVELLEIHGSQEEG